jgi:hypothetical protein
MASRAPKAATAGFALIWSIQDPVKPKAVLEAPNEIISFSFNPRDGSVAAGGLENGSIVLWQADFTVVKHNHPASALGGEQSAHGEAVHEIPWVLTSVINKSHKVKGDATIQQLQLYDQAGTRILGDKYHLPPTSVSFHYKLLQTLDINLIANSRRPPFTVT